jgi:hypothetical protein
MVEARLGPELFARERQVDADRLAMQHQRADSHRRERVHERMEADERGREVRLSQQMETRGEGDPEKRRIDGPVPDRAWISVRGHGVGTTTRDAADDERQQRGPVAIRDVEGTRLAPQLIGA